MRCKIVRFQKLMWHNIMRLTKSKKSFGFYIIYRYRYRFLFIYCAFSYPKGNISHV